MKRILFVLCFLTSTASLIYAQTPNKLSKSQKKKGWVLLFDGTSTKGWTTVSGAAVPSGWTVNDGTLSTVQGSKGGDIITVAEYVDFELILDYKIDFACNSGVKYFFTRYDEGGDLGLEYQILDDLNAEDNKQANHLSGSLYDILEPSKLMKKVNPPGDWNTVRIVAKGNIVKHYLNDFKILEFDRSGKSFADAVAKSKFSKVVPAFGTVKKGHILLQEHGGTVAFRNIRVLELK